MPISLLLAKTIPSAPTLFTIPYPGRNFYLYNDAVLLAQNSIITSCVSGTVWDSINNKCSPVPVNGGWSVWSPASCPTACNQPASNLSRACNSPAPANGGLNCTDSSNPNYDGGNATQFCPATAKCAVITCSIDADCGTGHCENPGLITSYCKARCSSDADRKSTPNYPYCFHAGDLDSTLRGFFFVFFECLVIPDQLSDCLRTIANDPNANMFRCHRLVFRNTCVANLRCYQACAPAGCGSAYNVYNPLLEFFFAGLMRRRLDFRSRHSLFL